MQSESHSGLRHHHEVPQVDLSNFPVLVITYPRVATVSAVHTLFDHIDGVIAKRGVPYAVVGDLRRIDPLTANAAVRHAFAERAKAAAKNEHRMYAEAAVFRSAWARAMLTAYYWLAPAAHATKSFSTVSEAVAWAKELDPLHDPRR